MHIIDHETGRACESWHLKYLMSIDNYLPSVAQGFLCNCRIEKLKQQNRKNKTKNPYCSRVIYMCVKYVWISIIYIYKYICNIYRYTHVDILRTLSDTGFSLTQKHKVFYLVWILSSSCMRNLHASLQIYLPVYSL